MLWRELELDWCLLIGDSPYEKLSEFYLYNRTGKRVGREEFGYPPPRSLILFVHVFFCH